MKNRSLSDNMAISIIPPALVDNTTANSGWLSVMDAVRVFAVILLGATDITADAKFQQATDSSGTGVKDVTGAAITQFTALNDNKFSTIDLETSALDIHNGFNYVRLLITVGDGTLGANVAAVVMRTTRHNPPAAASTLLEAVQVAG